MELLRFALVGIRYWLSKVLWTCSFSMAFRLFLDGIIIGFWNLQCEPLGCVFLYIYIVWGNSYITLIHVVATHGFHIAVSDTHL